MNLLKLISNAFKFISIMQSKNITKKIVSPIYLHPHISEINYSSRMFGHDYSSTINLLYITQANLSSLLYKLLNLNSSETLSLKKVEQLNFYDAYALRIHASDLKNNNSSYLSHISFFTTKFSAKQLSTFLLMREILSFAEKYILSIINHPDLDGIKANTDFSIGKLHNSLNIINDQIKETHMIILKPEIYNDRLRQEILSNKDLYISILNLQNFFLALTQNIDVRYLDDIQKIQFQKIKSSLSNASKNLLYVNTETFEENNIELKLRNYFSFMKKSDSIIDPALKHESFIFIKEISLLKVSETGIMMNAIYNNLAKNNSLTEIERNQLFMLVKQRFKMINKSSIELDTKNIKDKNIVLKEMYYTNYIFNNVFALYLLRIFLQKVNPYNKYIKNIFEQTLSKILSDDNSINKILYKEVTTGEINLLTMPESIEIVLKESLIYLTELTNFFSSFLINNTNFDINEDNTFKDLLVNLLLLEGCINYLNKHYSSVMNLNDEMIMKMHIDAYRIISGIDLFYNSLEQHTLHIREQFSITPKINVLDSNEKDFLWKIFLKERNQKQTHLLKPEHQMLSLLLSSELLHLLSKREKLDDAEEINTIFTNLITKGTKQVFKTNAFHLTDYRFFLYSFL